MWQNFQYKHFSLQMTRLQKPQNTLKKRRYMKKKLSSSSKGLNTNTIKKPKKKNILPNVTSPAPFCAGDLFLILFPARMETIPQNHQPSGPVYNMCRHQLSLGHCVSGFGIPFAPFARATLQLDQGPGTENRRWPAVNVRYHETKPRQYKAERSWKEWGWMVQKKN